MATNVRNLATVEAEIAQVKNALENVKGTDTEVYARIVGYYRSVRNWNKGKRDEYDHRKLFIYDNEEKIQRNEIKASITETPVTVELTQNESNDIVYYELFARKTCPNCPPVKEFMSHVDLSGSLVDVDSEEGFARASDLGIMAAPTVVFYNNTGKEIARAHNTSELSKIFSNEEILRAC